jgi:putative NIF3 family GTP cyclohydrolase 1 type 2
MPNGLTVKEIYDIAINKGIGADPRGKEGVKRWLKIKQKQFESLPKNKQNLLDKERLTNPYMDSRINFDSGKKVKKVLVGIDIDSAEVLLADKLSDIDLVITHHPVGNALANLDEVMHLQADLLQATAQMPINVAEAILKKRARQIARRLHAGNHHQPVDTARLLNMSLMSTHTIADNLVWQYIDNLLSKKKPEVVGDIIDILNEIPEYQEGIKRGEGPTIFAGEPDNRIGKMVASEFTGGTEPGKELYEYMSKAGVGTVVGMHMAEDAREEAEKYHINVVIAGHMSSDSLGMNLFLDELEKKGVEIVPCSGFIRVSRNS